MQKASDRVRGSRLLRRGCVRNQAAAERTQLVAIFPTARLVECCDKNVIVPCSERVNFDQNASECISGKRLTNQVE
jgi:hypothetical protein